MSVSYAPLVPDHQQRLAGMPRCACGALTYRRIQPHNPTVPAIARCPRCVQRDALRFGARNRPR